MSVDFKYKAKVTKVVDGDTLEVDVDLGFCVHVTETVRLYGVNTPEIHGPKSKLLEERTKGLEAKKFVENWVSLCAGSVVISSFDGKKISQEKYGRWLVEVRNSNDECLNNLLLENGHATPLKY